MSLFYRTFDNELIVMNFTIKFRKVCLLLSGIFALSVSLSLPNGNSRSTQTIDIAKCEERHETFPLPLPSRDEDGKLISHMLARAKFRLSEETTLRITEYPRSQGDEDTYNSVIVIKQAGHQKEYPLASTIMGGSALRLLKSFSCCTRSVKGLLVLAFQAGWTGSAQGFVLIRFSKDWVDVKTFPIVYQGRLVIRRTDPNTVELWSSVPEDRHTCDACEKRYSIQDCKIGGGSTICKKRPSVEGPISPSKFIHESIKIQ
jgi:hypothetical protein